MKIYKLIIGIVSIVLSAAIAGQSFLVSLGGLFDLSFFSGIAGYILSFIMLIAGIIVLCTRQSFGGGITAGCFYLVGSLFAYMAAGDFTDLKLWAFISFAFGASMIIVNLIEKNKKEKEKNNASVPPVNMPGGPAPYENPQNAYNNAPDVNPAYANNNVPYENAGNSNAPVNPGVNTGAQYENKAEQENANEN